MIQCGRFTDHEAGGSPIRLFRHGQRRHRGDGIRIAGAGEVACAELTAADVPPHLGLLHLAPFALNGRGHYLAHVARIIFAALGERSVTTADGETDQAALLEVFEALAALDEAALRQRAAEAWGELYGTALVAVTEL